LVTSKVRTGSKAGAIALLFSSALMLFVLLFGGTASADEAATTANAGAAGANTGGNGAAGNGSTNGANSNQNAAATGAGDDTVSSGAADSGNSSNGSASITTGDATATGNQATNTTTQTTVEGHNGVVSITDQNATVVNIGVAGANTGGNLAVGNVSTNTSTANQKATTNGGADDAVATNDATVRNDSGGDARISTGDATATGSTSNNTIHQSDNIDCANCLGVVAIGDQNATIVNVGLAGANTGLNAAVGNASTNTATANQKATVNNGGTGDTVSANTGTASTNSNGTAGIATGDATAVGNVATNNVTQIKNINAPGAMGVIVLGDQNATTVNAGAAIANTGLNLAVGNLSTSTSNAVQGAVSGAGPPADDAVASNDGTATTNSNGSANIATGAANAAGNRSTTNLTQALNVNTTGHAIVLSDQNVFVINAGFALANTGGNLAIGNLALTNAATVNQKANTTANGANNGDAVAANFGTASDPSNGSASINTGNAAAAGNESTTNVSQAVNANMTGGLVLPDQTALVINAGIGLANTGLNLAVGNLSTNTATVNQNAQATNNGDDVVASNFGDATTQSDGDASITTGNADSIGNASGASTNISQTVDTNGADMVLTDQTATSVNVGLAASNTGLNAAIGNASTSTATTTQKAQVTPAQSDAVASNFGDAATDSDGSASITTGNANSVGSEAHTNIAQSVNANGANGFLLTDQTATDINLGAAAANTGLNLAIGNVAISIAAVGQLARVLNGGVDDAVAANFGSTKTKSNGSASIHTGNAAAVGTRSHTNIAQSANLNGKGFLLPDQTATVVSAGAALANTGGNIAIGNVSTNNAATRQRALLPNSTFPNADDLVASNDSTASTDSNGRAEIWTGSANAIGNDSASTTNISQTANSNGGLFLLADQTATVVNAGLAIANSGLNLAVGNVSFNNATSNQTAAITESGAGTINADDLVVSNNATASATSDGSAKIVTGPSSATGNAATTNISQSANHDGKGFSLVDQTATVVNVGIAASNSGLNAAIGNASLVPNTALTIQNARITEADGGDINADDIVASNNATTSTNSNGSASITTGAATAVGSASNTTINQAANTNITGNGFALVDQTATDVNFGAALANSGVNLAVGNVSANTATSRQNARVRETNGGDINADDIVAANNASNTNNSNGSASIETGATNATGNKSSDTINQSANTNITGNGFALVDQTATVVNVGLAAANSGINLAVGNVSQNTSASRQNARVSEANGGDLNADDVVVSNTSDGGSTSDGHASIRTGSATATGNDSASTTVVNQAANTNIGGNGFALVDQAATVANIGIGIANSGINLAVGNVSQNQVTNQQTARISETNGGDLNIDGDAVAVNTATAWNQSNGNADIQTGDAVGVGNHSTTIVNQSANNDINGVGFELVDQTMLAVNFGVGVGNSGINAAIGNASTNINNGPQNARISEADGGDLNIAGDAVASNTASLTNNSDGRASITTGVACGYGNTSTTEGHQNDDGDSAVFNIGIGVGNSGINAAIGNFSTNTITDNQRARFTEADGGDLNIAGDAVAVNEVESANKSNGSADIHTGGATGFGNTSTTVIGDDSLVINAGLGIANTGINLVVGNASTNTITSNTRAGFVETGGGALTLGDDGVASNVITETNDSNGTANLTTGDAYALGNRSATGTVSGQDDTTAVTINLGLAVANSGLNIGAGNVSTNTTTHNATATAPGTVASNVATLSNTSDGSANIRTGNANAFGNIASNATCQGVPFGPECPQPTLPPLPLPCPCPHGQDKGVPPTVNPPVNVPRNPPVSLPNTGGSVEGLALLGLLLLTIGVFLRRKARTA